MTQQSHMTRCTSDQKTSTGRTQDFHFHVFLNQYKFRFEYAVQETILKDDEPTLYRSNVY